MEYFTSLGKPTREKIAERYALAREKGDEANAVAQGISFLIAQTDSAPAMESLFLPEFRKCLPPEKVYSLLHDQLARLTAEKYPAENPTDEQIGNWASLAFAFGRYIGVRSRAYSDGTGLLVRCAQRLFSNIDCPSFYSSTLLIDADAEKIYKIARRIRCLPLLAAGEIAKGSEFSGPGSDSTYAGSTPEVRRDFCAFARFCGDTYRENLENNMSGALTDICKNSLAYIAWTQIEKAPLPEIVSALSGENSPFILCSLLLRLRGNMQSLHGDSLSRAQSSVEKLLVRKDPAFAPAALGLLCEIYSADRICQTALWLLENRENAYLAVYALSLLFPLRNVWYGSTVTGRLKTNLIKNSLYKNAAWPVRAAAARVMGCLGEGELLREMLKIDPSYDVRAAAFAGLGGIESGGIVRPAHQAGDIAPKNALEESWEIGRIMKA